MNSTIGEIWACAVYLEYKQSRLFRITSAQNDEIYNLMHEETRKFENNCKIYSFRIQQKENLRNSR